MAATSLLLAAPQPSGPGWPQVHAQLARLPWPTCPLPQLGGLTLYHYCVAKACGRAPDAALAQAWLAQLVARLRPLPAGAWPPALLDQAALLAWLSADGLAVPAALLTELDEHLHQEALRVQARVATDAASRQAFFQVLRYFSLRLPAAHPQLRAVLAAWPAALPPAPGLGLVQGAASELLICIRLARAGGPADQLLPFVREGLRHLLAAKRDVDFSRQHYAIFPDELAPTAAHHPQCSAELSWRRGDLGQALLLYEAHELLQDPELAHFADLVGLHTLLRTTAPATAIAGAALYPGAAGVAHLYRCLYLRSRQPAYLRGYEFWLGQTHRWLPDLLTAPPAPDALRDGLAGVGLVLLSARAEQELDWATYLLGAG